MIPQAADLIHLRKSYNYVAEFLVFDENLAVKQLFCSHIDNEEEAQTEMYSLFGDAWVEEFEEDTEKHMRVWSRVCPREIKNEVDVVDAIQQLIKYN